ncbi:MAG: hypothetical protein HYZ40_07810 [Rhodospirillales bacterium]|nr:hypothetical protein [Rhodospirillales bacterium]
MRIAALLCSALMLGSIPPAAAEIVLQAAENKVPVTMIEVIRTPRHTEIRLQAQAALTGVCWTSQGTDSPYLLAGGRRYRFLGGDGIAACPAVRGYVARESMALRFEPLEPQVKEFSLVEGQGGENQMIDPASSKTRFWNFLRVKLK